MSRSKTTDAEVLQREETHQIPAITRNRYGKGSGVLFVLLKQSRNFSTRFVDECCREKSMQSVVTPQGVIGRKIAENQYFYVNLYGKGAENRASREWIWGAAGEKEWKIPARCRRLMVNW